MPAAPAALHQEVDTLYRVHHGWLQGWLRRRLGNSTEAADLAQDTFMRLLTRSEPIAAREPRAFLTTVAQGVVANFMRRRQIEEAYLATLAHLPEPQVPGPETRAILLETLVELDRRLDTLAPPRAPCLPAVAARRHEAGRHRGRAAAVAGHGAAPYRQGRALLLLRRLSASP